MARFNYYDLEGSGGPTVRRIILGSRLRQLREKARLTRSDAADKIRGSESKISRLELGRTGVKERDVVDLLKAYGVVDSNELDLFLKLLEQSHESSWMHEYGDFSIKSLIEFVDLEEAALRIESHDGLFFPGLLQTEDYARMVISRGDPDSMTEIAEVRVAVRMRRQLLLKRPQGVDLTAFVDESVLYRIAHEPKILANQIDSVLAIMEEPGIRLRIVSYRFSGIAAQGTITFFQFREEELADVVYDECLSGSVIHEKPEHMAPYLASFDRLDECAETIENSRKILIARRDELLSDM